VDKCPYNAIDINHITGQPEKCDFCFSRLGNDTLPVCVESCMGKAILFGDINDVKSEISQTLKKHAIKVLNPEYATNPSVFYVYNGSILNTPLKSFESANTPSTRRSSTQLKDYRAENTAHLVYTSDAMCPSECGISVLVDNGIARGIYGNPHSLVNNGTLCAKGASALQLTYSPHRIKSPMIRTGERGEDRWKEITWEEAADYIANKLIDIKNKYGPEAVVLDCGDVTDREAYYRLFHAFGTPNTYNHGSICDPNRRWGQGIISGDERPLPDIQRPFLTRDEEGNLKQKKTHDIKLLLNIGANPFVATRFNYMSYGITAAKQENGCIYIVVDPAHTNSAAHADMWLPIIPGSDSALLAAMLYYIIKNDASGEPGRKYIDHDFIEKYTTGWSEFREAFLAISKKTDPSNSMNYFSAEWAEEITGIPVKDIKKVSHLLGITKPAAIEIGMHGTAHHPNGDITSILMTSICIVTGNMDRPGGLVFIESQKAKKGNRTAGKSFLSKTVERNVNGNIISGRLTNLHKDLFGDFPAAWKGVLTDLPQKIREGIKLKHGPFKDHSYPAKAFLTRAGNPVVTAGNTPEWIDALTLKDENSDYMLELMVFIDTHVTVTGKYADIVLPEAGFLERMGVSDVYTMSPEIALRDQVIKPLHESKTPYEFMICMAGALMKNGDPDIREEDFDYKSEEAFINEILSEAPGFYNVGSPLPYPDLPEGSFITGTPDNPSAVWGSKAIKKGDLLTVEWLRKNNGVAVWPAGYYRYKNHSGQPSGFYPGTKSKKFEFSFNYLAEINKKFGTEFPETFYWSEARQNPGDSLTEEISNKYPYQLITGRVHHAMTMTVVCPSLAETETECMKPFNDDFNKSPDVPDNNEIQSGSDPAFPAGSVSIPVLLFNRTDAERLDLKSEEVVILENLLGNRIRGKVYITGEIRPGVIKTAFGPGGQKASGLGFMNYANKYTPNVNELHVPDNISPFTGMPGFGDIRVRILKAK
jgi:anaerobic selenocysteine-containing dehydrogenase